MKRNSFLNHIGKNAYEKEAYKDFLTSKFQLDKTEADPADLNKTDSSPFEDEKNEEKIAIKRKSWWLKFKDWINTNLGATIIGGLILAAVIAMFTSYVSISVDQGKIDEKITNIEKRWIIFLMNKVKH